MKYLLSRQYPLMSFILCWAVILSIITPGASAHDYNKRPGIDSNFKAGDSLVLANSSATVVAFRNKDLSVNVLPQADSFEAVYNNKQYRFANPYFSIHAAGDAQQFLAALLLSVDNSDNITFFIPLSLKSNGDNKTKPHPCTQILYCKGKGTNGCSVTSGVNCEMICTCYNPEEGKDIVQREPDLDALANHVQQYVITQALKAAK